MPNTQSQVESSLLNPFTLIGGLCSDLFETVAYTGNTILDIPSDLKNGWDTGAIITPSSVEINEINTDIIETTDDTIETTIDTEIIEPMSNEKIDIAIAKLQAMRTI